MAVIWCNFTHQPVEKTTSLEHHRCNSRTLTCLSILPLSKIVDFMSHLEENISSKPSPPASIPTSFTLVKITEPVFPNEDPDRDYGSSLGKDKRKEFLKLIWNLAMHYNYQFLLFPLARSRRPPPWIWSHLAKIKRNGSKIGDGICSS